jgi:hypothetical protein
MLIDDAQHAKDLFIMGVVLDEVVRTDIALLRGSEPRA